MSSRLPNLAASLTLLATMLSACSDPLDDEPKGQTIPTHTELATGYAAGSGPFAGGGGSPAPGGAGSDAGASSSSAEGGAANAGGMPAGLVGQTQGGGGGGATGFLPPRVCKLHRADRRMGPDRAGRDRAAAARAAVAARVEVDFAARD